MWYVKHESVATAALAAVVALVLPAPVDAAPNMIRLGYPTCQSCHLTPQGGGLLTSYGWGIDLSKPLRPEEPDEVEYGVDELGSRFNYDARLSLGIDRQPPAPTAYGYSVSLRTAVGLMPSHRLVYAATVRSSTLTREGPGGAVDVSTSSLYWLYQPRPGLSFTVGRDDLPTGLGLQDTQALFHRMDNPNVPAKPAQAKVFWWDDRWQVSAYAFGPDGSQGAPQVKAGGGGALVGANLWRDRVVAGFTTRVTRAGGFGRSNAGLFARIGLTEHWGILAEHDLTRRATNGGADRTHLAGHTQLFFVPYDWLQTSFAVEHLRTSGGADTWRLSPSADLRLTSNIKLAVGIRDVYPRTNSRTYLFSLQIKAR